MPIRITQHEECTLMTKDHKAYDSEWEPNFYLNNSQIKVIFHSPKEVRMGLNLWEISFYQGDKNISTEHLLAEKLDRRSHFFFRPIHYSPWIHKEHIFCFVLFDSELNGQTYFYSLKSKSITPINMSGIYTLIGSPYSSRVALKGYNQDSEDFNGFIMDTEGNILCEVPLLKEITYPNVYWLKDSGNLLCFGREERTGKTWLYHIDSVTGDIIEKTVFDAEQLFPYNRQKYSHVERGVYSLATPEGAFGIGILIDDWKSIHFDGAKEIITARIYRPKGEIVRDKDLSNVVEVEEYEIRYRLEFE